MNGKRARAIRAITKGRQAYRAGKRLYTHLGQSKSQNPTPVAERYRPPMAVAESPGTDGPLRRAFVLTYRNTALIRNAIPFDWLRFNLVRHESLDRLFGRMPGPVIRQTLINLETL
jgi:hypothetical protein